MVLKTVNKIYALALVLTAMISVEISWGQQDPQFTNYTVNTMTVNPAYTGSRGYFSFLSLYRSQWVGIEGSPRTLTLSMDSNWGLFNGVGLSVVRDELGPSQETFVDANYAHQLYLNDRGHILSLGVKAGVRSLSLDWSRGLFRDPDVAFNENLSNEIFPTIGAGAFYFTRNAYFGLSVPNFLTSEHFDEVRESMAAEKIHFYAIGGYVWELNPNLKFKPAFFLKYVDGSPLSWDVSASMLFLDRFTLGLNYRWDESISALAGFQLSQRFSLGYSYDYSTGALNSYNSGSHEIFLRYDWLTNDTSIKSTRLIKKKGPYNLSGVWDGFLDSAQRCINQKPDFTQPWSCPTRLLQ